MESHHDRVAPPTPSISRAPPRVGGAARGREPARRGRRDAPLRASAHARVGGGARGAHHDGYPRARAGSMVFGVRHGRARPPPRGAPVPRRAARGPRRRRRRSTRPYPERPNRRARALPRRDGRVRRATRAPPRARRRLRRRDGGRVGGHLGHRRRRRGVRRARGGSRTRTRTGGGRAPRAPPRVSQRAPPRGGSPSPRRPARRGGRRPRRRRRRRREGRLDAFDVGATGRVAGRRVDLPARKRRSHRGETRGGCARRRPLRRRTVHIQLPRGVVESERRRRRRRSRTRGKRRVQIFPRTTPRTAIVPAVRRRPRGAIRPRRATPLWRWR